MTTHAAPICYLCKHFLPDIWKGKTGICKAFPGGIPEDIWYNREDHRSPYPDDNDIQFEGKDKEATEATEELARIYWEVE